MPRVNGVSFHEDPSIESVCRRVVAAGFDSLEVSRPPFFEKLTTTETRQRFRAFAQELGLGLHGFDCWVDVLPYTAMDATLDGFRAAVQFAQELDLGMIISHDPWMHDNEGRSADECLRACHELFRQVAAMCAEANLSLVFEPHPDTHSMDDRWCIDFIDGLEHDNVGVLYDCCHYGVGQPETYVKAIEVLGSRIRHLHFSDGDRQTYALHLPLDDGSLDLPGVTQALKSIEYNGTLTNDLYNYPLLDDGARRNAEPIRQVEQSLGLTNP